MKYLVLLGDGMADFPLPEINNRTPLEVAFTPSMDEAARLGIGGLFCPIPEGCLPGSDIGNLSVFGYDPRDTYTGRAPLEAANQGIQLGPDQIAFRCNLVTLEDGVMRDFTSGHISTEEAAELIQALSAELAGLPVTFSPGVGYRHLTIITASAEELPNLEALKCTPPHDITGRPYEEYLPSGPGSEFIVALMQASRPILAAHPVNAARIAAGKPPATSIWLWGQGRAPRLQPYRTRFGLSGSVISAVDLVNGIGVAAGLSVIKVPGATGYLDTNYKGKVHAAFEAFKEVDFVYLHVEAPDETSHEGRVDLKIRAIEDFDAYVVAPCLEYLQHHPHMRLLVAPDHVTSIASKTHELGAVPFALCGEGVTANDCASFSERAAQETGLLLPQGYTLTSHMLRDAAIDSPALNQVPE